MHISFLLYLLCITTKMIIKYIKNLTTYFSDYIMYIDVYQWRVYCSHIFPLRYLSFTTIIYLFILIVIIVIAIGALVGGRRSPSPHTVSFAGREESSASDTDSSTLKPSSSLGERRGGLPVPCITLPGLPQWNSYF